MVITRVIVASRPRYPAAPNSPPPAAAFLASARSSALARAISARTMPDRSSDTCATSCPRVRSSAISSLLPAGPPAQPWFPCPTAPSLRGDRPWSRPSARSGRGRRASSCGPSRRRRDNGGRGSRSPAHTEGRTSVGNPRTGRVLRDRRTLILSGVVVALVLAGLGLRSVTGHVPRLAASGASPAAPSAPQPAASAADRPGGTAGWIAMVRAENARRGTRDWKLPAARGRAPGLDAYAGQVSVLPGRPVSLYVGAVPAAPVRVEALRVGYYGGAGARRVWSGMMPGGPQPPTRTSAAAVPGSGGLSGSRMVVAPWHRSGVVDTTGWPEGDYLLRVDGGKASRLVPLTVRSAQARGRVLLVAGAMTWEAYNTWGGRSLYTGGGSFGGRSYAVSFDRPYSDSYGAGRFPAFDAPIVRLAERDGLPLAWATDYDIAEHPQLLEGAAAIVIGGHAEYWTASMWEGVRAAVGRGTNLAVLGANTAYWRVRLADLVGGAARAI